MTSELFSSYLALDKRHEGHTHSHSHGTSTDGDSSGCPSGSGYNGNDGIRILAVFILLISSAIGSFSPLLGSKYSFIRLPDWFFFIAKYFGSGVIIATGFIHLLFHSSHSLGEECLGDGFTSYPWAYLICLASIFTVFFVELLAHRLFIKASSDNASDLEVADSNNTSEKNYPKNSAVMVSKSETQQDDTSSVLDNGLPLKDEQSESSENYKNNGSYSTQLIAIFVLEFGVLFHSVFVGLSLAVAGDEFNTLFIVLIFHQMFEGLGLGARIAETNWPRKRRFTPWMLALAFAVCTPISIAIGIGVKKSYAPYSSRSLIFTGVFDAISAGILIYAGIVELMAHEFFHETTFQGPGKLKSMLCAFFIMCLGAGLMSLLGKWA